MKLILLAATVIVIAISSVSGRSAKQKDAIELVTTTKKYIKLLKAKRT